MNDGDGQISTQIIENQPTPEVQGLTEQLQAELAFRAAVINRVAEGLCVCHETTDYPFVEFTVWNERMTELTGYSMEEINHRGWYQTLYPDPEVRLRAQERMAAMRQGHDLHGEEWPVTRCDGRQRVLSISTSVLISAEGCPHILALMLDVTERKRAQEIIERSHHVLEESVRERTAELEAVNQRLAQEIEERKCAEIALRESEERYRTIVETAHEGVWVLDSNGCTTFVNRRMSDMLGYGPDDMIGRHLFNFMDAEGRDQASRNLERRALRIAENQEFRFVRADGSVLWTRFSTAPIHRPAGQYAGAVGMVMDITERKRTESLLQERSTLTALLAEVVSALISQKPLAVVLQTCAEAIVEHLEASFARIWTLNEAEQMLELEASAGLYTHLDGAHSRIPVGQFKIGRIAGDRQPHLTNAVVGDPQIPDQEWAQEKGIVAFAGYPLVAEDRVVGVVGMFACHPLEDFVLKAMEAIADALALGILSKKSEAASKASAARYRQLAEQNAHLLDQSRHDGEVKNLLLKEVRHRVKNNLASIIGLLYAQRRSVRNQDSAVLTILQDVAQRIEGLAAVHQMFCNTEWSDVPLTELATEIIQLSARCLPLDKQVSVSVEPSSVRVGPDDANSLTLVINELATNTIKHSLLQRQSVCMTVRIRAQDGNIQLTYQDDGPGYPEEALAGTKYGVGLYLMENIIRHNLRGTLRLHNAASGAAADITFTQIG